MTLQGVIELLSKHVANKEHQKSLAVSRADAAEAMAADSELIETRDTIARIEALLK